MRLTLAAVAVAGLLASAGAPARADSVTDQLGHARQYYEQGDYSGAIEELEFAIQEIRGKLGSAYLATFPAPAPGWTVIEGEEAGEQQGAAAAAAAVPFPGGGNVLKRRYRSASGEATVDAQLMTGGSFLQGLASMFMSPQLLAAQPNAKRVRIGRENAVVIYDPEDKAGQLMLDVGGKASLMLDGKGLPGPEPLVDLATRWDLKRVREIAGL